MAACWHTAGVSDPFIAGTGAEDRSDDDRFHPIDVEVKRDTGVTITFADEVVAVFNMVELRLGCPCAECRNLRDRDGGESWPRPNSPIPLGIVDAEFHGGWGLSLTWNDGHNTGIYPFEALRRWAETGDRIR
jgi:DUF971 family protein